MIVGKHYGFEQAFAPSRTKLRIFATGFAGRRAKKNPTHQTFHQSDIFEHFVAVARDDLGHDVERGGWDLGDPIPEADLYIVDVLNPEARTTSLHSLSMIDLMGRDTPILLVHSDWQIGPSLSGFRSFARHPERLIAKTESGYFRNRDSSLIDVRLVQERLDAMHATVSAYMTQWRPNWVTTIPMLPFGVPSKVMKYFPGARSGQLLAYDPSPYVDLLIPDSYANDGLRDREWIVASLTKPSDWLGRQPLGWPIQGYGRWAGNRVHEDVVVAGHQRTWGSISVPHGGHKGSGWQRARYVLASKSGAVTLMDPVDRALFGPPYQHSAQQYEGMTDMQLRRTAADQYEWLTANTASYDDFIGHVEAAIERAVSMGAS